MSCWTPEMFDENWIEYSETSCFGSNSFEVPADHTSKGLVKIANVFKWVPLTLLLTGM